MAVVFNPLAPVYLRRDTWSIIDLATAVVLVVSLGAVREASSPPEQSGPDGR